MQEIDTNTSRFYPWFAWGIVAFLYLTQYGLFVFPSVIASQLQQTFSINSAGMGVLSSAFLYTYVMMQIPVGLMLDRYSTRRVLTAAALCMVIGCFGMAMSNNYFVAVAARMLTGFGGSFMFVGAIYLGRMWFPSVMFPLIVGLTEAMSGVGSISFTSLFAVLTKVQSYQSILFEVGILSLFLALMVFFFLRNRRDPAEKQAVDVRAQLDRILRRPRMWLLGLYVGMIFTHFMVMANMWEIPLLEVQYHLTPEKAVFENSFVTIGFSLGAIFIGYFSRFFSDRILMLLCSIIQFICLGSMFFLDIGLVAHAILLFIAGFVTGAIVLCFDVVKEIVPIEAHGAGSGFLNMFFGGTGIIFIPLVGYLLQITNNNFHIATIPIVAASFATIVVAIFLLFRKKRSVSL